MLLFTKNQLSIVIRELFCMKLMMGLIDVKYKYKTDNFKEKVK